jgi:hypothetical protein
VELVVVADHLEQVALGAAVERLVHLGQAAQVVLEDRLVQVGPVELVVVADHLEQVALGAAVERLVHLAQAAQVVLEDRLVQVELAAVAVRLARVAAVVRVGPEQFLAGRQTM